MSAYIKRQIDSMYDNVNTLELERDELHYEVYLYHRERRLLIYELTLKEFDNQYDKLKRLEKNTKLS